MTENLLRFNNKQKYLFFDFETANLSLVSTLPWQLGFITAQGKNITGEFERKLWWENYEMADNIAAMNHFNRFQYEKEARPPEEVLEEFDSYLYDPEYIILGQNIMGFDCYVHNNLRLKLGKKTDYSYMNRMIDLKALSTAIFKGAKNPPKDDFLCWQHTWLNYRERGLKTNQAHMLKYYNIPHDPSLLHGAIYDCKMGFEIFLKQLWEVEI